MSESRQDQEIYLKLIQTFDRDFEGLLRVLWYLDQERHAEIPIHAWNTLQSTRNSDAEFTHHTHHFVAITKTEEMNRAFRLTLTLTYEEMMEASNDPSSPTQEDGFSFVQDAEFDPRRISCFQTLGKCWGLIPPSSQSEILLKIPDLIANRQGSSGSSNPKSSPTPTPAFVKKLADGLEDIALSSDAIKNLQGWWKGEITGKRCTSNLTGNRAVPTGFRIAGCVAGARIGGFAGPIGRLVGCIVGGFLSAKATEYLDDKINEEVLGIPKDEALENAYKFFGLPMTATNQEVNTAFKKMCLKHHPDKGGKAEDFILVQVHMGVIKCARGDLSSAQQNDHN